MITEDYVSFETAKLLKEKGYKGPLNGGYSFNGYYNNAGYVVDRPNFLLKEPEYQYYERPTVQTAIKWLREAHKLFIGVDLDENCENYFFFIVNIVTKDYIKGIVNIYFPSYKEAREAGIKYCLENLI